MIILKDICKYYDNRSIKALHNICLHIERGEAVALTGPSGCGKSTMLNILGSLDEPDSGTVTINNTPLAELKPWSTYRSTTVGFIFQFHHLIPALTLAENIELPMYSLKIPGMLRQKKVKALLKDTEIEHRAGFYPAAVSGGERQRAAIARALINDPLIILADEPTGSIDSRTGTKIMNLLIRACRQRHAVLVLATHNHQMAAMTDRIVTMRDGRIDNDDASPLPA